MRLKNKYNFIFLILLSSLFQSGAFALVSIRGDTWCPYNCDPKTADKGFMIDVAAKAFADEGIDYQKSPWARSIVDCREGAVDAIVGATHDDAPDFIFADILGKSQTCLFTRKSENWTYSGAESLKGKKLGIIQGYSYTSVIDSFIKENGSSTDPMGGDGVLLNIFQKIVLGRNDVVPEDKNVANYMIKTHAELEPDIKNAGCIDDIPEITIAFSPKDSARGNLLKTKLNSTISSMKANGELLKLAQKYGIEKFW